MNDSQKPGEREAFYNAEIAPMLKAVAEKCLEHDMSIVAVVEYMPGEIGRTRCLFPNCDLAMVMVNQCAKMGTNVDGYIIGLLRYAVERKIDLSTSIVMQMVGKRLGGNEQ